MIKSVYGHMSKLFLTVGFMSLGFLSLCIQISAEPLSIGRLPAHRSVKVAFTVKVNDDFPHSASQLSQAVSITSTNASTVTLPSLTNTIYYTPVMPVLVTFPSGGTTRDTQPSLSGTSDPNTTIEIYDGIVRIGTVATDGAGNWNFIPSQALSYGVHSLKIRSINGQAQISGFSAPFELTVNCPLGVYGSSCSDICPGGLGSNACNGKGVCSDGLEGTGVCTCESGYFDHACNNAQSVCAVDITDGVYKDSEWLSVNTMLSSSNTIKGAPYYWKSNGWVPKAPAAIQYLTDTKNWFAISGVKSCLGYVQNAQVLFLMMQSQFPLGTYFDTRKGTNSRFGEGSLPRAGIPDHRLANVIWKMMAYPTGSVYYIVLQVEFNKGDTFRSEKFRSLKLYREGSADTFNESTFVQQSFDPNADIFTADLSGVVNALGLKSKASDAAMLPVVETGVDLLSLLTATGWSTATQLMVQSVTQDVSGTSAGQILTAEIDHTGTVLVSGLATRPALRQPSVQVLQPKAKQVTLKCVLPSGQKAKRYQYALLRNSTGRTTRAGSTSSSYSAKINSKESYRAACSYVADDGQASDLSVSKKFKAK